MDLVERHSPDRGTVLDDRGHMTEDGSRMCCPEHGASAQTVSSDLVHGSPRLAQNECAPADPVPMATAHQTGDGLVVVTVAEDVPGQEDSCVTGPVVVHNETIADRNTPFLTARTNCGHASVVDVPWMPDGPELLVRGIPKATKSGFPRSGGGNSRTATSVSLQGGGTPRGLGDLGGLESRLVQLAVLRPPGLTLRGQ